MIAAVLIAGLLSGSAESAVVYREIFPNDNGVDAAVAETGWKAHVGEQGISLPAPTVRLSGNSGRPKHLAPIASAPANDEIARGFLFNHDLGRSQLLWTDECTVEVPADQKVTINWEQSNDTSDPIRLALRMDGVWLVSSREFVSSGGYTSMSAHLAAEHWLKLDFVENGVLALGPSTDPTGAQIDAVGFYVPKLTGKLRLDTVEVRIGAAAVAPGMINSEALMQGFIFPPIIFNPGEEYGSSARNYQGISGIERAPGGRLWATWYAGPIWEDQFNYALVATSGDNGVTWTDVSFVVDPDGAGPKRVADPVLWLDPDGKLWFFFWLNGDGLSVTMAMTTENPDDEKPDWTKPFPLFPGVMMNKPIVTSEGEWLMPAAIWHRDNSCRVMVSGDSGKSWALRGTANIPPERRNCDEEMIVERSDGTLWMLVRTADYGIGESVSTDHGKTWTEVRDYQKHATSRFTLLKLKSGNLLLVRNGPVDERVGRVQMMAYLSDDDGASWKGGLLLDNRGTSYPDATQAPDGTIYAIYDQDRGGDKGIVMAIFTEADILAGKFCDPQSRGTVLINKATGVNPKLGHIGDGPALRTDSAAAELIVDQPRAVLESATGECRRIPHSVALFSDSDYILHHFPRGEGPIAFNFFYMGKQIVVSPMAHAEATCVSPGMVYVFTPVPDRNPESVEAELLAQGFEKTSVKEFDLIFKMNEKPRLENACSVYQKNVKAGEKIEFGKWGVLAF